MTMLPDPIVYTLIQLVRHAIENGCRFIAIDDYHQAYGFVDKPAEEYINFMKVDAMSCTYLGHYDGRFKRTSKVIDIDQLKGVS